MNAIKVISGMETFYVGTVETLSGLVKFPITSIKSIGLGIKFWDLEVVGVVDKKS